MRPLAQMTRIALTHARRERFTHTQVHSPLVLVISVVVLIETTGERTGG